MRRLLSSRLSNGKVRGAFAVLTAAILVTASAMPGYGTGGQTAGTTGGSTTGASTTGGSTTGAATTGASTTGAATAGTTGATTGAATAGTGGAPTTTPPTPATPVTTPVTPIADAGPGLVLPSLKIFGLDYFADARRQVDARRRIELAPGPAPTPSDPANPLANAIGPDQMAGGKVSIPVPERYQLGPGDTLVVRFGSPVQAAQTVEAKLDSQGMFSVPGAPTRVVLRGLTLEQASATLRRELRRYLREATIDVQLKELRSISIRILGEAYAPGTYEVPSIITAFNALYVAGGPSDVGSLRNIRLKRSNGINARLDMYQLLINGDGRLDVPLQPGDVILIPPAVSRVSLKGEVRRPAIYELLPGERLREAVAFAGGAKASGVTQRVSVESVRPGIDRRLIDANLLRSQTADNPPLYDGDVVEIFSIRNVFANRVVVEGAVDQPRAYAVAKGMRISDVIDMARGVLPEATLERADLYRLNPDNSTTLIPINLGRALRKDPSQNVPMVPNDRLVVYKTSDIQFLGARKLFVQGAVAKPGSFYRSDGMTVRDLIYKAGGLALNANDRVGLLQRTDANGLPGPLVSLNLGQVLKNDPKENLYLQDDDVLIVNTILEAQFIPEQSVEVTGAVQRPGSYTRSAGMKVTDLLALAGGPLPDAYFNRAFVQRVNLNGTQGPLIIIDLAKAAQGSAEDNIVLEAKDRVSVFTLQQATYQVDEIVTVNGAVQRPGPYRRSSNMTLKDVIDLAGGILPNSSDTIELSKAWSPLGTPVQRIRITDMIAGATGSNPMLSPGDTLTLPLRSDLSARPKIVIIQGQVQFPGPYMLTGTNDRLSYLVNRAGGLTENAFPEGSEFTRDPKNLNTDKQRSVRPQLADTLRIVSDDEYKRATALADLDRLRIVFSQGSSISSSGALSVPGLTSGSTGAGGGAGTIQPGQSLDQALAQSLRSEAVTKARPLTERDLIPSGNLNVNVDDAIRRPGSRQDIVLMDGDVINVPERPTTVSVTGAVALPSSILYEKGKSLQYYIERSGGVTLDAATESTIVIRANGALIKYKSGVAILLGDTILVPTKVMAIRLQEKQSDILTATQILVSAGLTLALIKAITK